MVDELGVDMPRRESHEVFYFETRRHGCSCSGVASRELEEDPRAAIGLEGRPHALGELIKVLVGDVEGRAEAPRGGEGIAEIHWQPQVFLDLVEYDGDDLAVVGWNAGALLDRLP
ncbi:hypothetical protein GCM10027449_14740 [Sinomonas notoginsengisoli]